MMLAISSLSVRCRNIVLLLSFENLENVYMNILCSSCSFSYKGQVIIKGVGNIIGIGYSIIIISREYSWHTGWYNLYRNKGFDSFQCVLNIIPILFKIFIIIRQLFFLHKGGEWISIFFVLSVRFLF